VFRLPDAARALSAPPDTLPKVYVAREREATTIPLSELFTGGKLDILAAVQNREYFDLRFKGDQLVLTAGKYVGLIPINRRVFIRVEPKVPVKNLLSILSAVDGDIVELDILDREYSLAPNAPPRILEAIATAFRLALRRVEVAGLVKRYEERTTSGPWLKGRLLFGDSVAGHWGRGSRHTAVSSYFDLTADTAENRMLRFACQVLLSSHRTTGIPSRGITELSGFDDLFAAAGVSVTPPETTTAGLDRRGDPLYVRALRLADLIIRKRGVDLPGGTGDMPLPSFLLNMESLFERYARHVLRTRLHGWRVLDGNEEGKARLFDDRPTPHANPDIVIRGEHGSAVIGEVKYKGLENRDDINQVLAYALSYRVKKILLVLPAEQDRERGLAHVGRVGDIELQRYRIDLAACDLAAEERAFADSVQEVLDRVN